jgi:hypothetical protein
MLRHSIKSMQMQHIINGITQGKITGYHNIHISYTHHTSTLYLYSIKPDTTPQLKPSQQAPQPGDKPPIQQAKH